MMATYSYFHGGSGSEIQVGGAGDHNLQTLYLMNPNYFIPDPAYSESQSPPAPAPNMLFFNNPPTAIPSQHQPPPSNHILSPAPHQQQFIGIPLGGPHSSEDHNHPCPSSSSNSLQHHHQIPAALHGMSVSRVHPNLWSPSPSQQGPIPAVTGPDNMGDQMSFRRPVAAQGLSLSLSPGQNNKNNNNQSQVTVAGGSSSTSVSVSAAVTRTIPESKYLKAAQELLEEVVNVGSTSTNNHGLLDNNNVDKLAGESCGAHIEKKAKEPDAVPTPRDQSGVGSGQGQILHGGTSVDGSGADNNNKKATELSTAQKQELQMKKAKLLNMLEEVEQRYRQYNTQMQVVVSSFEQAAGSGSATLYTSLALKTISKQFRCLKDAIMSQIKDTSKSLGEEDSDSNVKLEGGAGSRLRFVDHQLRQQRALQQLGMMQHNAWRPQRGLPERAVSVLRAWLFEHFLHPYPKDSDKHMLAKQTGLTRSQVSNWFINARVRLWKPMVEEMYLEEIKTEEQNSGNNPPEDNDNTKTTTDRPAAINNKDSVDGDGGKGIILQKADNRANDMISNISTMSTTTTSFQGFTIIGSSTTDMESLMTTRSPKKQRSNSHTQYSTSTTDMEVKPALDQHHQQTGRHSFLMPNNPPNVNGFNPYIVNDMMAGRTFNPDQLHSHSYHGHGHGNTVSLTLGLPHCDTSTLSLGNQHQINFLPNKGIELGRHLDIAPSHPNNNNSNNGYI